MRAKKNKISERAEKYGCSGECYGATGMCPAVEWCEETKKGEFFATVVATFLCIVIVVMLAPGMLMLNLADWLFEKLVRR